MPSVQRRGTISRISPVRLPRGFCTAALAPRPVSRDHLADEGVFSHAAYAKDGHVLPARVWADGEDGAGVVGFVHRDEGVCWSADY